MDLESSSLGQAVPRAEPAGGVDATARVLGTVLRAGVLISAAIILLGIILFVHRRGIGVNLFAPGGLPSGGAEDPSTLGELLNALNSNSHVPAAVTDIGLLTLMITPVLSVIVSMVSFARARDWTYVAFAAVVLCMLALGSVLERI
ncbi:MAG TPA: DUF1634 domain-containing protein [bacterium]|nr:DUF1634 domain-containing protein [bacterium]